MAHLQSTFRIFETASSLAATVVRVNLVEPQGFRVAMRLGLVVALEVLLISERRHISGE